MSPSSDFKVIIAGGGVAGLTLAILLEKFNIDYVLLESHDDISPPVGASIGLMPNGLLILDQIGCYDAVRVVAQAGEFDNLHIRAKDGKSMKCTEHMFGHMGKRLASRDMSTSPSICTNSFQTRVPNGLLRPAMVATGLVQPN